MNRFYAKMLIAFFLIHLSTFLHADQFVLFDKTFEFTLEEALKTKSHLSVAADQLSKACPKDWTSPIDYRNGSLHIRLEVIEKPAGETPTTWSLCYIPNKGQKNGYGCTNTPVYTKTGVYEQDVDMTKFWNNDSIIWTEGIKLMTLVLKGKGGEKPHAHLQPNPERYFPTKVRVTMIQISKNSDYNSALVLGLDKPQTTENNNIK